MHLRRAVQVYDILKPVLLEKEKAEQRLRVWPLHASLALPLPVWHCQAWDQCCAAACCLYADRARGDDADHPVLSIALVMFPAPQLWPRNALLCVDHCGHCCSDAACYVRAGAVSPSRRSAPGPVLLASQEIGGDMEWTIVRPGGLKNDPSSGRGVLTESRDVCGAISREDVAELVVKALFSDSAAGKVP